MEESTCFANDRQLDLIKEIINIGVGHAAESLNSLVDSHIERHGVVGSISNLLDEPLDLSLPDYFEGKLCSLMTEENSDENISAVLAHINFTIESLQVTGSMVLIFELRSFSVFILAVDSALKANETSNG